MKYWSSSVSKTHSVFLNPVDSCPAKRDSFPLVELIPVHIFCRCYSLVLNVGILENPESCSLVVFVAGWGSVLLGLHMDLLCYMFLPAVFSNSQMDMRDAT